MSKQHQGQKMTWDYQAASLICKEYYAGMQTEYVSHINGIISLMQNLGHNSKKYHQDT